MRRPRRTRSTAAAMTPEQFAQWRAAVTPPPADTPRRYRITCEPCGHSGEATLTLENARKLICSRCKCQRAIVEQVIDHISAS
jgi:hypothetical protein